MELVSLLALLLALPGAIAHSYELLHLFKEKQVSEGTDGSDI